MADFVYSILKYADRTCKSGSLHMVGTIGWNTVQDLMVSTASLYRK